jgi:D-alanyl-lipoteichoic acid acyltransferase DltB (MBOAT superfamily)
MVSNLGLLAFFKYFNFFIESLEGLLSRVGMDASGLRLDIVLPVGISFYTFQTMSYTIDVYRREMPPAKRFLDFALFVAFFPQLVAGPIERARALLPQMENPRHLDRKTFGKGVWLIFFGLWKKILVADNLARYVDHVFETSASVDAGAAYLGVIAFAFQIYCDFSGYSDIARGVSRIMGFELMRNFDLPYFARNPTDFWKRWHISLSSWLRDYLYIPLGGNRASKWKIYRNLMLTMLLGGLWHGAAWNFIWWGLFHGLILVVHRPFAKQRSAVGDEGSTLVRVASIFTMFQFTLVGWLLFRSTRRVPTPEGSRDDSLQQMTEMIGSVTRGFWSGEAAELARALLFYTGPLLVLQWLQYRHKDHYVMLRWPLGVRAALYAFLLFTWVFYGAQVGTAFIYFQF